MVNDGCIRELPVLLGGNSSRNVITHESIKCWVIGYNLGRSLSLHGVNVGCIIVIGSCTQQVDVQYV